MYCVRKVSDDLWWVGGNDRRLAMFEGVYSVPNGVSYNSYLLLDDYTVLFDTVDPAVSKVFFENIEHVLAGRELNFLVIQHMEPDHSGMIDELLLRHPETVIVCGERVRAMLRQFRTSEVKNSFRVIKEGSVFNTSHHELTFLAAPMVHWPEVMVSYEESEQVLFSADAFGRFGTGDPDTPWLPEARRYYIGIVGKYGAQVTALLKKAAALSIGTICPLHGPVLTGDLTPYLTAYRTWASYEAESAGVAIAYTSVYGHTKEAALLLADTLRAAGVKTEVFDLARDDMAAAVAAAFRYDRLVLATTTYNADLFPFMRTFIEHLCERGFKGRRVGFIENGSWVPRAALLMRAMFEKSVDLTFAEPVVTLRSALSPESHASLLKLADWLIGKC